MAVNVSNEFELEIFRPTVRDNKSDLRFVYNIFNR